MPVPFREEVFMQLSFTFRQFEATDDLRDLISEKVESKLGKFVNGKDLDIRVTIATEKAWTLIDMVVSAFGDTFKCSEKTTDLYPTIDVVIDKIERQLLKKKGLFEDRRKKGV